MKCLVVDRCVTLLWSLQKVLELEYVLVDQRKGLKPDDCEYGLSSPSRSHTVWLCDLDTGKRRTDIDMRRPS